MLRRMERSETLVPSKDCVRTAMLQTQTLYILRRITIKPASIVLWQLAVSEDEITLPSTSVSSTNCSMYPSWTTGWSKRLPSSHGVGFVTWHSLHGMSELTISPGISARAARCETGKAATASMTI